MPSEDWMTVSIRIPSHDSESMQAVPEKIQELHYLAEAMRDLASKPGGASVSFDEWKNFALKMKEELKILGDWHFQMKRFVHGELSLQPLRVSEQCVLSLEGYPRLSRLAIHNCLKCPWPLWEFAPLLIASVLFAVAGRGWTIGSHSPVITVDDLHFQLSVTVAWMLLGAVAFMMALFYLVNNSDNEIRSGFKSA
eukprot:symbB.v1.2.027015.t1/scaffold2744.1/size71806/1